MIGPELWARPGGEIKLEASPALGIYSLRVTDAKREVTISFTIHRQDIKSLRKWLKESAK